MKAPMTIGGDTPKANGTEPGDVGCGTDAVTDKATAKPRRAGRPAHGGAVLGAAGGGAEDGNPQRGPQRPRGAAAAAGGRPRRGAGGLRRRGHGKGRRPGRLGGPTPSGRTWCGGASATGTRWSTARARDGPPPWFPRAAARWRSRRSWGCAGSRARPSRGAACGVCGP